MCLGDVFLSFKGKNLTHSDLSLVAKRMKERGMTKVSLWNMSSNTRMMFGMVRLQSITVVVAASLLLPLTVY